MRRAWYEDKRQIRTGEPASRLHEMQMTQRMHAKGLFMADTFWLEIHEPACAKACGHLFLDCTFRVLIGWAGKLLSRG